MQLSDKHMDLLTLENLRELLQDQQGTCISMFLPTDPKLAEQNPIRLKNLLKQANQQLEEMGLRTPDARKLLQPAFDLLDNREFWQYQSHGLALFVRPGSLTYYRLPLELREFISIGKRFRVKPILPMLSDDGHFYALFLSLSGIKLLQGSHYSIGEIPLGDGIPKSLEEATQYDQFEKNLQFHTGTQPAGAIGSRAAVFHGQGSAGDEKTTKTFARELFKILDTRVTDILNEDKAPLVLAGIEVNRGLYREVNHYEFLLDRGIDCNPEDMDAPTLHQRSWDLVQPLFEKKRQEALDRYQVLSGRGDKRAASHLEDVVAAATFQQIESLFVPAGTEIWGTFDPESRHVKFHPTRQPGDDDLLDLAVAHTLRNAGTAYNLPAENVPGHGAMAAILRF
ncbi:hypothetical protein HQ520_06385 [bacterium]|nr:hypothetical protein [bacterium]